MKEFIRSNRNKKKTHKAVKTASPGGVKYLIIIIGLLFFMGMTLVIQSIQYTHLEDEVRQLLLEKRNLEIEVLPLKIAEQRLINLDDVEKYSQKKLNMVFPKPSSMKKIIVGSSATQ